MNLWNNIRRYAIYRKLLVSYLILVLLSIVLITAVLYQRFSYQSEAEINRVSMSTLDQVDNTAEALYDQVFAIGSELLHDPSMISSMLSGTSDPLLENEVVIKLKNIQAVYPFIEYISVYNGNTGRYLNHKGITGAADREVIDLIAASGGSDYMRFVPREVVLNPAVHAERPARILSFVLFSNFSQLIPRSGALVINIDEEEAIGRMNGSLAAYGNQWMLLDAGGTVLSHSDPAQYRAHMDQEAFFGKIVQSDEAKGYFLQTVNGKQQLIVYAKSAKTKWISVGIRPLEPLFWGFSLRQLTTWGTALLLAIAGILFSVKLASRMYTPYSAFQSQHHSLETSLRKAFPILKDSYVRRLLSGRTPPSSLPGVQLGLPHPADAEERLYCVVLLKIDDYRQFASRSYKEQDLVRFAIRNIADDMLRRFGDCHTLEVESDHLVVLAPLRERRLPDELILALIELQRTIRQYFKLSVTAAIGDIADSEASIKDSYESAQAYVKYRLLLGHGSIIDQAAVKPYRDRRGEYPSKTEALLLDAVGLGRRREAEAEIGRFIEAVGAFDCSYAFVYANQLVLSIRKKFDSALSFEKDDYELHGSLLYAFSDFETLAEVGAAMKEFCGTVIDRLEEKRSGRNRELVEAVCRLIRAHYSDPGLSLEWAAEQMHYSSGHLSKQFKQVTGQSFNEYLNAVRLEDAIRLLTTTGDSASAISEQVGLGSTYFYTLFKKTYGMTPAQFRSSKADIEPSGSL